MPQNPEAKARENIDQLLIDAGWDIQDMKELNIMAKLWVAVREFPIKWYGEADYLLYVDGKAIGVIEAKKEWDTLTGVETQSAKYSDNFPDYVDCWKKPLAFSYQSTGIETRFTNHMEPEAKSRNVFAFHRPETLLERVKKNKQPLELLKDMPELIIKWLRPAQIEAINKLEKSLADNRPKSLIQMATWSGKTFTACNFAYRLIKFGGAKRILFLVDRGNLARQTHKEFQQFTTPDDGRKFTEIYNVQNMKTNHIDDVSNVSIATIQRMFSMLSGHEIDEELEEQSMFDDNNILLKDVEPIKYNPNFPIESFDYIVVDECHRSIYNLWRQVLDYFDAKIIGLTATPSKQTIGFFDNNLIMEYNHERAVADWINVDFWVYKITTEISDKWSKVEAWYYIDKRHKLTRKVMQEKLDEDMIYWEQDIDRSVVVPDQIRTIIKTFRDKLSTEIMPGRTEVPKTLIFAKTDNHAEDIVKIVRDEFGKWNDFCQKITYKTTGKKPEELLQDFRNSYNPRIAVTVDMIATGTDIKPLEIVFFMRDVKSQLLFEQMKWRWVRVMNKADYQQVTPDNDVKTHFVIVDAVWVCERDRSDMKPLERQPNVSFEKVLQAVAMGNTHPDVISTLVSRLIRIEKSFTEEQKKILQEIWWVKLKQLCHNIVESTEEDIIVKSVREKHNLKPNEEPSNQQYEDTRKELVKTALKPIYDPNYRKKLLEIKQDNEQVIDIVSIDKLIYSWFSAEAKSSAKNLIDNFQEFLEEHKEELELVKAYYSKSYKNRVSYKDLKEFTTHIEAKPLLRDPELIWTAFKTMYPEKVMETDQFSTTDFIPMIEFAGHNKAILQPYKYTINEKFGERLEEMKVEWKKFTPEQSEWLELMKDEIANSVELTMDSFDYGMLGQKWWLGWVDKVFDGSLSKLVESMNSVLVE